MKLRNSVISKKLVRAAIFPSTTFQISTVVLVQLSTSRRAPRPSGGSPRPRSADHPLPHHPPRPRHAHPLDGERHRLRRQNPPHHPHTSLSQPVPKYSTLDTGGVRRSTPVTYLTTRTVIPATLALAIGIGVGLLVLDGIGWRLVSALFNRERLIASTR